MSFTGSKSRHTAWTAAHVWFGRYFEIQRLSRREEVVIKITAKQITRAFIHADDVSPNY